MVISQNVRLCETVVIEFSYLSHNSIEDGCEDVNSCRIQNRIRQLLECNLRHFRDETHNQTQLPTSDNFRQTGPWLNLDVIAELERKLNSLTANVLATVSICPPALTRATLPCWRTTRTPPGPAGGAAPPPSGRGRGR